ATTQSSPPTTASAIRYSLEFRRMHFRSTWTASSGAVTSYLVERCQEPGCSNFAQVGTSTSTAFMDTGLFASKSYTYRVQASGPEIGRASCRERGDTTQAPAPPNAPTNLT